MTRRIYKPWTDRHPWKTFFPSRARRPTAVSREAADLDAELRQSAERAVAFALVADVYVGTVEG